MEAAPTMDSTDVGAIIMEAIARTEAMGANDSERSVLLGILRDFEQKKISAQEAIERAHGVVDSKQDYH